MFYRFIVQGTGDGANLRYLQRVGGSSGNYPLTFSSNDKASLERLFPRRLPRTAHTRVAGGKIVELGFDLGGAVALAVRDLARVQKLLAHFTRCEKVMSVLSRGDHWAAADLPEIYAILLDDAVVTGPRGGKSVRTAQHLPALKKLRNCVTEHLGLDGAHAARMRHDASAAQKFEQKCRLRLNTVSSRYLEEHTSMSALAKHAHGILVAALAELERVIAVECARMDTGLLESALRATLESAEATLSWREVLITKKRKAKGQKHAPPPVRTEKEHKLSCGAMRRGGAGSRARERDCVHVQGADVCGRRGVPDRAVTDEDEARGP